MLLLVYIDVPDWLQQRIDQFIEYCRGEIDPEELYDAAFKRRIEPNADLLGAEEWLHDKITYVAHGRSSRRDAAITTELYRIVDKLTTCMTIDRDHRAVLTKHDELSYCVSQLIGDTMVISINDPEEDDLWVV